MSNKTALTTQELKLLNSLLNRKGVKGLRALRQFIFFNTYKSKYKINDYIIYNARNNYVYGVAVRGFIGVIESINAVYNGGVNDEKMILYHVKAEIITDEGEHTTVNHYINENEILRKTTKKDTQNRITKKGKYKESMSI